MLVIRSFPPEGKKRLEAVDLSATERKQINSVATKRVLLKPGIAGERMFSLQLGDL